MKHIFIAINIFLAIFMASAPARAEEQICVQNYGQPVVCGAKTPEYHVPVQAGLGDIDIRAIGIAFLFFAGITFVVSAKKSSLHR